MWFTYTVACMISWIVSTKTDDDPKRRDPLITPQPSPEKMSNKLNVFNNLKVLSMSPGNGKMFSKFLSSLYKGRFDIWWKSQVSNTIISGF